MADFKSNIRIKRIIDTNAGFLLEEDAQFEETSEDKLSVKESTEKPNPLILTQAVICLDCGKKFQDSYLFNTFGHSVCDACKDLKKRHPLITKTEAKVKYLLKDCDFDQRGEPLKCILKRNPHNMRWGNMKLYLELQVKQRALLIHGSEDALLMGQDQKVIKSESMKAKKYQKKMKELRMSVRSSLWKRDDRSEQVHEHEYVKPEKEIKESKSKYLKSSVKVTTDNSDSEDDSSSSLMVCKICGHEVVMETL